MKSDRAADAARSQTLFPPSLLDGTLDRTLDWTLHRPVRLEIGLVVRVVRGPRTLDRTLDGTRGGTLDWAVSFYFVVWAILIRHRALLLRYGR
jgi:hypothetical protein